jgi:hypothetical protein
MPPQMLLVPQQWGCHAMAQTGGEQDPHDTPSLFLLRAINASLQAEMDQVRLPGVGNMLCQTGSIVRHRHNTCGSSGCMLSEVTTAAPVTRDCKLGHVY